MALLSNPYTFNVLIHLYDHKKLNFDGFATESLHFQCFNLHIIWWNKCLTVIALVMHPYTFNVLINVVIPNMFLSYHPIYEPSFPSFAPSFKPPLISSTFELKGSPKMPWSYHPISVPSCHHPFPSVTFIVWLLIPYTSGFNLHIWS